MKKISLFLLSFVLLFGLSACKDDAPMTPEEEASHYNLSLEDYNEMKDAAARMNMTMEDHMKMMGH